MQPTPKKARKLLKTGKANVVKRVPFTIHLSYATGETKQPIRTCSYCRKANVPLEVEHIIPKSRGGSDRVSCRIDSIGNIVNTNIKNVELVKYGKGLQFYIV